MTDPSFPITPPPELVQQWFKQAHESADPDNRLSYCDFIATRAAQWGGDQELEACCEWAKQFNYDDECYDDKLRAARRPRLPPETIEVDGHTYQLVK
jgi:hypothetical protein